jgi:hypothetical protein
MIRGSWRKRGSDRNSGSGRRRYRPGLDALETRNLLASSLTATLSSGLLTVEGTPGADTIHIRQSNNQISVDGVNISIGSTTQSSVPVS